MADPSRCTQYPIVTGQSILGIKYKDGVIMASDTLLCYGKQKKFKSVQRLFPVGTSTLVGFSGEYSDIQELLKVLNELETADFVRDDACPKNAVELSGYLARVFYEKRCNNNPYWNQCVVGGWKPNGEPHLAYVDMHGTTYEEDFLATGFGAYFALPLLRERANRDMTLEAATELLMSCMRILYARDCLGHNKVQIASVTKAGVTIQEPVILNTKWNYAAFVRDSTDPAFTHGSF